MKIILFAAVVLAAGIPLFAATNSPETNADSHLQEVEQKVRAVEQAWATAVKERNIEALLQIEAEEYQFTGPGGEVWTRSRSLEAIKSGDLAIDAFELSDVRVRIYGRTAVVTMQVVWTGRFRGTDISGPQRMTDVFVERDGRWQCVASQSTRVVRAG